MNKLTIISAFLLNLVIYAATAPPRANTTLLATLVNTNYKCPFLRTTFLNSEQYPFLKECPATMKPSGNDEIMCTIFYNNFIKLCANSSIALKSLINDSTVQASYNIDSVCDNLKTIEPMHPKYKDVFGYIKKYLETNCHGMCSDFLSGEVTKICAISGLMSNVLKQYSMNLDKVVANAAQVISKNETVVAKSEVNMKSDDAVKDKSGDLKSAPSESNQKPPNVVQKPENHSEKKPQQPNDDPKPSNIPKEAVPPQNIPSSVVGGVAAPPDNEKKLKEDPNLRKDSPDTSSANENKLPNSNVIKINQDNQEKGDSETANHHGKDDDRNENVAGKVDDKNENVVAKGDNKNENVAIKGDNHNIPQDPDDLESNFEEKLEDQDPIEMMRDDEQGDEEDIQPAKPDDLNKPEKKSSKSKPKEVNEDVNMPVNSDQIEEEDSFFFIYFMMVCAVFILGYIGYHNKQKVLALVIEGRRGRRNSRRGGRPNSANYHKLDSNLEEAVTSSVHKNTTNIIY